MPSDKKVIALRVEDELFEKLAAMANQEGRSVANMAWRLIERGLVPSPPCPNCGTSYHPEARSAKAQRSKRSR